MNIEFRPSLNNAYGVATKMLKSAQLGKAVRGGAWTMSAYGVQTILRFISRILLAKLLITPAPLGQVAVISTILSGMEMISDLGTNISIVQHKDGASAHFLGTVRTVALLRSSVLCAIALMAAYPAAWLYHDHELAPLMMFSAVSILCRGFANPGMAVLVRNVNLKGPTLVSLSAELIGFAVTVAWALQAPSAWALVGGSVAASATVTLGSQFAGARTRFAWDSAVAKNILQFGGWIILSTGTYFLSSRGEVLILKGSVPDILFGCFAFASMLVQAPLTAITQLGSQVMLPFLATWIRAGEAKAQQQFRRTKWLFTGFGICFSWGAILVSPWLVKLLHLNRSYANVEWMVQCLGVRAAFDVFVLPTSNSLLAAGVSRFSAVGNVVRLAVLVSGLFLTVKVFSLGMTGAMWILVGAPPIAYLALLPGLATAVRNVIATEIVAFALFCTATAAAFGLYLTTRPLFG